MWLRLNRFNAPHLSACDRYYGGGIYREIQADDILIDIFNVRKCRKKAVVVSVYQTGVLRAKKSLDINTHKRRSQQ